MSAIKDRGVILLESKTDNNNGLFSTMDKKDRSKSMCFCEGSQLEEVGRNSFCPYFYYYHW